jgi:cytidine deaminase
VHSIQRQDLPSPLTAALHAAGAALDRSYCPHSRLSVAAGLLLDDDGVITGVNYECDSYGLTLCAERAAIARARAEGVDDRIRALVLLVRHAPGGGLTGPLTPCGACRQWLAELARRIGRDLPVYSFAEGVEEGFRTCAAELLPGAFHLNPS